MACNVRYKNPKIHTSHYLLTSTLHSFHLTFTFVPLPDIIKIRQKAVKRICRNVLAKSGTVGMGTIMSLKNDNAEGGCK